MSVYPILTVSLSLILGLGTAATSAELPLAPDIVERAARLVSRDVSQSPLTTSLTDWERAVLTKLEEAATYMDEAYWQQVDPEGRKILADLSEKNDETAQAVVRMLDAHYGRWDRFRENEPFIGSTPRPAGGFVYPLDLTKAEFDTYIAAHPDEGPALLSPYTVVVRNGRNLKAVPYHEAYAQYVLPTAALLDEAARLSKNPSLSRYLSLQANALRTDDYFEADLAWLDLDGSIDLSIGPHETYDDQLAGIKAFYKANVQLVDRVKGESLAKFKATAPELQKRLPVPAQFRPDQTGTMMPILLVDDIRRSGQIRAVSEAVAYSLPNDPRVWKAKGSKKIMMGNYLDARRTTVLEPLVQAVLAPDVAARLEAEPYVTWVLMHEISHTLGPRHALIQGVEKPIPEALGRHYAPIEEGKADIGSLYALPYLLEQGIITGTLESHYVGYLAEALRSIRFGLASAYGYIRLACWNILVDEKALRLNKDSDRFELDVPAMTVAVQKILQLLLEIEGQGNAKAAETFLQTKAKLRPGLTRLLQATEDTVPIEFVPVYHKTETSHSPQDDIAAIDALRLGFNAAYEASDAQALANLATPDAVWMPPGREPIVGREAVAEHYARHFGHRRFSFELRSGEVKVYGKWAVLHGPFTRSNTTTANGTTTNYQGHYLMILTKQPDSSWRISKDIWNETSQF